MEAIINLPKKSKSSFKKHNFRTFPVVDVLSKIIALNIDGVTVDFTYDEVAIYDVKEVCKTVERRNQEGKLSDAEKRMLNNLYAYCKHKGIVF